MNRIMITGAGGNASQNFVKCLPGLTTPDYWVLGTDVNKYQLQTSYLHETCIVPSTQSLSWLTIVLDLISRHQIEFINFQTDCELAAAIKHPVLRSYMFAPNRAIVETCQDKLLTAKLLGDLAPHSMDFNESAFYVLSGQEHRPVWMRMRRGAGSRAALPVTDWQLAKEWLSYWIRKDNWLIDRYDFMLSEFLPGREFAIQLLYHHGKLITTFARERIEYVFGGIMPSGQSSSPSVAASVHDERVNAMGVAAIERIDLKPHGVYGVDMKENAAGELKVTEINAGRFFTTMDFAARLGLNMVTMYLDLFFTGDCEPVAVHNHYEPNKLWIRGMDREPVLV